MYQQQRNAERRAAYLCKEKQNYEKSILSGKRKLIINMLEREQRQTRKNWAKRKQLSRRKLLEDMTIKMLPHLTSTPSSLFSSCFSSLSSRQKIHWKKIKRKTIK